MKLDYGYWSLHTRRKKVSFKEMIILFLLIIFCCTALIAEENQVRGETNPSFALIHRVAVDASLSYKFVNSQGANITSKNLEIGTTNIVGLFYATFNTTRRVNIQLIWTPLIMAGEAVASAETAYPYTMTLSNHSGNAFPEYSSPEAGIAAAASEFVVYDGEYGAGHAFFINKWLNKTTSQMFEDSLLCSMSISIDENDNLPPGVYSGSIYFVATGN